MPDKKKITKANILKSMHESILNSFSNSIAIEQKGDDFYIINKNGYFIIKTFLKETIEGTWEAKQALEKIINENKSQEIGTAFIFPRSVTDYKARKNLKLVPFLKQSWDKDKKTGESDHNDVKLLADLERGVEKLYSAGKNKLGYQSRLIYFDSKKRKIQAVSFRHDSAEYPLTNVLGKWCEGFCIKGKYDNNEMISYQKCKKEKRCTQYAIGRNKRQVIIRDLKPKLAIDYYTNNQGFLLAKIK